MLRTRTLAALPFAALIVLVLLGLVLGRGGSLTAEPLPDTFRLSNGMDVLGVPHHPAPARSP